MKCCCSPLAAFFLLFSSSFLFFFYFLFIILLVFYWHSRKTDFYDFSQSDAKHRMSDLDPKRGARSFQCASVSCNLWVVIYPDCVLILTVGTFCPSQSVADRWVILPGRRRYPSFVRSEVPQPWSLGSVTLTFVRRNCRPV